VARRDLLKREIHSDAFLIAWMIHPITEGAACRWINGTWHVSL